MIPKQLGELLQETQEPFMLDIYLLERGCSRNRFSSSPSPHCCSLNSKKGPSKRRISFQSCSRAVKTVLGKLVFVSNRPKVKKDRTSGNGNNPNSSRKKEDEAKETVPDDRPSDDNSLAYTQRKQTTRPRDSVPAIPFCKFSIQLPPDEPYCIDYPFQKTEKAIHQSKQLVFDCVRELIESHKWKLEREQNLIQFMGPDEIGKLLSEDIRVRSKLSGNESSITQLPNVNFGASINERRSFVPQTRDIGAEIGDAIFEDISTETVAEMVALVQPHH